MNLLSKLKETGITVVPILLIVLALHLTIAPLGAALLVRFLVGGALIILGLGVFLLGTDIGVLPVGIQTGSALVSRRNLALMIGVGFLVGFLITIAEPDVQVLATQVATVNPAVSKTSLLVMIGLGVGLFVALGFGRIVLQGSYRWMLVGFYIAVFVLAVLTNPDYLGMGFDSGGVTTGPMTVPFIMALGVGVASASRGRNVENDSFGMVGLASIGPIMAVLFMGILARGNPAGTSAAAAAGQSVGDTMGIAQAFFHEVPEVAVDVLQALGPLALIFVVFQLTLLRMPPRQLARMVLGLIYSYIGLVLFLVGVNGGFFPAASKIGGLIASLEYNGVLIPIGFVLGAVVVLAEPAVWVLNNQVEEVSGGHIPKRVMLISLSIGVSVAVAMAMIRVVTGLSIWWFLVPGYALALGLTFVCPPLFTAIAFDSGGVASGPMSSTFILTFTLGASAAAGGNPITDAFGVVAMIAMTPLITIQVLGLIFRQKERKAAAGSGHAAAEGAPE